MTAPSAGAPTASVIEALGVTQLIYRERVGSTMDEVHRLAAEGAPAGTVVLASMQEAGRGRSGRPWLSEPDAGLWFTVLERPDDARALEVLALRVGLSLAEALTPLVHDAIGLKWPNDLLLGRRKLAGILIEVRWRDARPEWVAIGVGINRRVPEDYPMAAAVRSDVSRDVLLQAAVPAVRAAARGLGALTATECAAWAARDAAAGRPVREPVAGVVEGITPQGAVVIRTDDGRSRAIQSGSLVFAD
ncbi:MAG: biotin--[acetyl-CoA-carboxylase] ligase [Gemmatimonadaceae bacterium]|nr:biotin--[acetyl-CoA-carboxylase] ligase [Gemmatimonadaceae bacterium]